MTKTPQQPQDKYVLRLPDGMRDRIKRAAEASGRSMNAEMVHRLEQSFSAWTGPQFPEGYAERILYASPQKRMDFETQLSSIAIDLIERYFPRADAVVQDLHRAFSDLVDRAPYLDEEKKKDIWSEFDNLVERLHIETLESE